MSQICLRKDTIFFIFFTISSKSGSSNCLYWQIMIETLGLIGPTRLLQLSEVLHEGQSIRRWQSHPYRVKAAKAPHRRWPHCQQLPNLRKLGFKVATEFLGNP